MRIALGIEYDGAGFCGWQIQPGAPSVQSVVERALGEIVGQAVRVICAGRTDTGVHAIGQVVHFDVAVERTEQAWVRGGNAHLPPSVTIRWARQVSDDFHARFSAEGRRYRYLLLNRRERPGILAGKVGWCHQPLDEGAMRQAGEHLLGQHDFSSFRAAQCQAKSPVKTLKTLSIYRQGDCWQFDFHADAFLHHMVRNIIGSLVYVGMGRQPANWLAELLAAKDRRLAAPTFSPAGLYLTGVDYAPRWELPTGTGNIAFSLRD